MTALTAQNTTGVQGVYPTPPEFVEQQVRMPSHAALLLCGLRTHLPQLRSVLDDVEINAIKTGMLVDADVTRAVARTLKSHYGAAIPPLVCDPVCVSTSGHTLLHPDAVDVMISELFPLAAVVTPNKAEAVLLLSQRGLPSRVDTLEDMLVASRNLLSLGPRAVLLKGGHITTTMDDVRKVAAAHPHIQVVREGLLGENMEILQVAEQDLSNRVLVVDALQEANAITLFVRPRIDSKSTHGTGCTLSAALATALSRGKTCMHYAHTLAFMSDILFHSR